MTETSSLSTHTANVAKINETQHVHSGTDRDVDVFVILAYVITPVIILGLVGNGAVFWFLCCRIKRTKYTVYVLNIAIADFTVLFSYILCFVFSLLIWNTLPFIYLYITTDILTIFGYNTSFFLLTTISVERCLGAFYPLWYHFNRPKHLSAILCALQWVLSCVVTGLEYSTCWSAFILADEELYRKSSAELIFLTIIFLIFIPVMVLCSLSLFVKIRINSQPKSPARFYLTVVITVVLFLIFALPFRLVCLIGYWHPSMELQVSPFRCAAFLNFINSSVNPFVYFLVGRKKQQTSREKLHMVLYRSCKDEMDVVPQENMSKEQEA